MKYTAIKKLDNLGRLVFPREMRKAMGITSGTELIIEAENDSAVIKVFRPVCNICGSNENVSTELRLCEKCLDKLKK